jgi:hypothetical protein
VSRKFGVAQQVELFFRQTDGWLPTKVVVERGRTALHAADDEKLRTVHVRKPNWGSESDFLAGTPNEPAFYVSDDFAH